MQLDKFMGLNIVPRYLTVFFQNLTSGKPEECICVSRNLRLLVLFLLAVETKGGGLGLDVGFGIRDLVPFIVIAGALLIYQCNTVRVMQSVIEADLAVHCYY
jgi:hypothetical protein